MNDLARKRNLLKEKEDNLLSEDYREGLSNPAGGEEDSEVRFNYTGIQ